MRVDALRRLNRDHLYMEVWLRPIGHIARDWDITSANLRAACKALGVTVPSVGHWAAIRAGDAPQPPALPICEDATTITAETRPRESLVEWMKQGAAPAASGGRMQKCFCILMCKSWNTIDEVISC